MNYVCGFMMTWDLQQFLLIRKTHPDWQKGKLNGIGGKIECTKIVMIKAWYDLIIGDIIDYYFVVQKKIPPDCFLVHRMEIPQEAMIREFHEETGMTTKRDRWHCFHIEDHQIEPDNKTENAKVFYFAAFGDEAKFQYIGENSDPLFEVVSSYKLTDLFFYKPEDVVYNVPYLIRMIIDSIRGGQFKQLNPQNVNNIP